MTESTGAAGTSPPEGAAPSLSDAAIGQLEAYRTAHKTQVLTMFFSDLVGSTASQARLGNVRSADLVRAHRKVVREVLATMDGEEVETAGDSFLIVFAAPSEGVRFALTAQAALRAARVKEPEIPDVRMGVHQGQVVVERHAEGHKPLDVYGIQVSTAARIADLAKAGQILLSRVVFDDARAILRKEDLTGLAPVAWRNHGPYRFKGVEDPHEVCEVGEEGSAPLSAPPAGAKGWPAGEGAEEMGWRPAAGVTVPGSNWILARKLGQGEFGEVWMAENRSDKSREVFKFCFKRDRLPALKREARLLKRLRRYAHPNLVEVYDVTEGARPPHYLEMEYVEGPSLAEWLASNPPRAERLEVVAQVADALDTVHAAGITHRDIKPSNILLTRREDGALQAKLTDFGLGAADDEDLLRSIAAPGGPGGTGPSGTWAYLAPELQAGSEASAQSDLYSLGVTLFQIVVGDLRRPLTVDWATQVPTEALREDVHRSIARDPADRWRRGADLATSLRTHDQRTAQKEAEREREGQRLRARRARRIAVLAGAFAAVVLVLGGVAALQWGRAEDERAEAQKQRDLALEQKRLAFEAIGRLTHEVSERLANVPGTQPALKAFFEDNVRLLDRILALDPNPRHAAREKAANWTSIGRTWRILGDTKRALEAFETALSLSRGLVEAYPEEPQYRADVALTLSTLGDLYVEMGRTDVALRSHEEALATARKLVADEPASADRRRSLWDALDRFGLFHAQVGRTDEAAKVHGEALAIAERLAKEHPSDEDQRTLSLAHGRTAANALAAGRPEEALTAYEAGMAITRNLASRRPGDLRIQRDLSLGHTELSRLHRRLGQEKEARDEAEAAVGIARRLSQADPANVLLAQELAAASEALGNILLETGDSENALAAFDETARISERLAVADPARASVQHDLALARLKVGRTRLRLGRAEDALASFREAETILAAIVAKDPGNASWRRTLSIVTNQAGDALFALGKTADARAAYERSLATAEALSAADPANAEADLDVAATLQRCVKAAIALEDVPGWRRHAKALADRCRKMRDARPDASDARARFEGILSMLAEQALAVPGTADDFAAAYGWAGEVVRSSEGKVAEHLHVLARAAFATDRLDEALTRLDEAVAILLARKGDAGADRARAEMESLRSEYRKARDARKPPR